MATFTHLLHFQVWVLPGRFFLYNFTKFYSYHINTGLTHGLALNKWQVIILINDDQFCTTFLHHQTKNKQRVLMHRHQGWNVRHGLCHIYMRYVYIYELFIAFVCFIVCSLLKRDSICGVLCGKWQSRESTGMFGTLWLFIMSCHSLYKTTLGSLCSWKPAWSLKKHPHSMCLKPFVKMCIFVVIQIFWSLRKYREQ